MRRRNLVVALPVLPFNEQKYADVVQILDHYEQYIEEIYQSAEVPLAKVHIGGDQLTRERDLVVPKDYVLSYMRKPECLSDRKTASTAHATNHL